jgi:uncharacterized membrane protein YgaE (UPF0421/DUF939 family)
MTGLAKVFAVKREGFNLRRGIGVLVVMLVPLVALGLLHQEKYFLSVAFAALFVDLSDPGGEYGYRVLRMALVAAAGALLTALGFAIGDRAWGVGVLAAFVVTVLAGLAVEYGRHRFTAAMLLNIWFLIALALPAAYRLDHLHTGAWAQALAWLIGSALTIAYTGILWLTRGRTAQPQPGADVLPGDITPVKLTRPVILFVLIRAIAVSAAVAIAFGLHLPNADWMPVATVVAMKPSLQQSTLVAEQRLAGAIIGAAVAALFLLALGSKTGLEVVIVILGALAGSIRAVNYALYCAAVAGAVLSGMDLPHPSNLADEGRRILFTFVGVGIAVLVMLLADPAAKTHRQSGSASTPNTASQYHLILARKACT